MSGLADKSAFESFERMAEKIEATERKALAAAELNEEVSGDLLARQFEALEYKGSSDQQLLELKTKMGILAPGRGPGSKQIGTGRDDVRDAELIEEGDEGKAR
jgi:phage shock protein A